jgi:predicted adenine nucleotide alpha hydrolase (AANH) superfamily ATPase
MNILLHVCCAPCAIYPVSRLRKAGFQPTGYFYNPNIHPSTEYSKRLAAVREYSGLAGLPVTVRDDYDLDAFLVRTVGKGPNRCEQCYRMRLDAAGAAARSQGFNLYTTSLLYSKYQKHDLIRSVALEMAREHGIELYYEDFRTGWRKGITESKAMGLYRQQYCGCIYSERDRYVTGR